MNWSQDQRRLLQALGHELLVHGVVWPRPAPTPATAAPAPASRRAPPAPSSPGPSAPERSPTSSPARLLEALRRAAGGAEVSALVGDLEGLRRDPALKRALWPRLRALRRSH